MKKSQFLVYHILFVLMFCSIIPNVFTQIQEYTHPELEWYTIETGHFEVHFHKGAERTAKVVARIGEDIYKPITDLYDYRPDGKIHFIIKDFDDNSNGAAYYYDNKVEIWAPQMTFILRGTHNWLRNVVTHEFSHMISLGASRKITRKIPSFYLQLINYEKEKRPDVLYGYPNQIVSYPLPMTVIPMWLAEGMAQYQISGLDYDRWDTHRDMLIRTAVVNNKMHSFDEMGVFGKNSLGNERTYNAGYALTRYITYNWGEGSLAKIARELKKPFQVSVNGAIKNVTGQDAKDLYDNWRNNLKEYYDTRLVTINAHSVEGRIITQKGLGNISPEWSPDGSKIAYCGSETADYLTLTSLKVIDMKTGREKTIKGGVNGKVAWSPDGKKLLYPRMRRVQHHSHYFDLHVCDLDLKKEQRLTNGKRTVDPAWSPDGKFIVCVIQHDGTDNLILLDDQGKQVRELTRFRQGEGLYSPNFSPDGKSVVFTQARNHGRDLRVMDLKTGQVNSLVSDTGDARDAVYSPDGQFIYFSWDKTGIFNIYRMKPDGSEVEQITNVIGGAFMPSVDANGKLCFSNFNYDGYKIAVIDGPQKLNPENTVYLAAEDKAPELQNNINPDKLKNARAYDDRNLPDVDVDSYSMNYGQMAFLPRIMLDSNKVKLGTYFYASDILDRYSVLGGAAMNARTDLDAFAIFEFRKFGPTLFLELYGFTRNVTRNIEVIEDYPKKVPVDIHFNILEADIGYQNNITDNIQVRLSYSHQRYTSKIKDFTFQGLKWVSPNNTYFIGNAFMAQWNVDQVAPGVNSNINPNLGRRVELRYSYELNKFFEDFATDNDYGTPQEVYSLYKYHRVEMDWREYLPMPWSRKHALALNFHGGFIDRPVDSFFNFFAGGLPGLRGYPFYSIEGRKLLIGRFAYRFPVFSHIQKRFLNFTTDKFYAGAFFDYGNAFDEDRINFSEFKKNVGFDLRFTGFSFYGFPTALSISSAYSLDRFEKEGFTYGREWRYYISLLFEFMD
ncbi:PD40 domain-containing protein [candidate division KSB1 bacterium]|nr:PD40 domain-containing protein [candidate division KSB1 bacterium]